MISYKHLLCVPLLFLLALRYALFQQKLYNFVTAVLYHAQVSITLHWCGLNGLSTDSYDWKRCPMYFPRLFFMLCMLQQCHLEYWTVRVISPWKRLLRSSWNVSLPEGLLRIFRGIDTPILDNELVSTLTLSASLEDCELIKYIFLVGEVFHTRCVYETQFSTFDHLVAFTLW